MTTPAPEVRAAGAVVWRPAAGADDIEVLVVHRPRYDDWSHPKGKLDAGEGWEQAAAREVWEETGLRGSLGPLVASVHYRDRRDRPKEVRYFELADPGGVFVPNDEVDRIEWLPPGEARRRVTRADDAGVIDALLAHRAGGGS